MLANYNKILPKIAVHCTTGGRCCSESSVSSFYIRSKSVVFNLGREPFLEGSRVDILCTKLYYICFIQVLDGD